MQKGSSVVLWVRSVSCSSSGTGDQAHFWQGVAYSSVIVRAKSVQEVPRRLDNLVADSKDAGGREEKRRTATQDPLFAK